MLEGVLAAAGVCEGVLAAAGVCEGVLLLNSEQGLHQGQCWLLFVSAQDMAI